MADERKRGVEAEREPNFLFARLERRFLPWAAGKLPRWILPDDMTALGVLAALGVCAAVMLSLLTVRVFGNLRELAEEEPSAPRR